MAPECILRYSPQVDKHLISAFLSYEEELKRAAHALACDQEDTACWRIKEVLQLRAEEVAILRDNAWGRLHRAWLKREGPLPELEP